MPARKIPRRQPPNGQTTLATAETGCPPSHKIDESVFDKAFSRKRAPNQHHGNEIAQEIVFKEAIKQCA